MYPLKPGNVTIPRENLLLLSQGLFTVHTVKYQASVHSQNLDFPMISSFQGHCPTCTNKSDAVRRLPLPILGFAQKRASKLN